MFISKKKYEQTIEEAQQKAFQEADKMHWQNREMQNIIDDVHALRQRVEALENKGKKPRFRCPCMIIPNR